MDVIVDNYLALAESVGMKVEDLEDKLFINTDKNTIEKIYQYKLDINFLRKSIRPLKDFMQLLIKSENSLFKKDTKPYLERLISLVNHVVEAVELYNGLVSDQLNIYNANASNKMNEIMKVLTIFSTVFIPLTFIAGIYGMNFEYLPELKFKFAYPIFWLVALLIGGGLLIFFKKKKWL